MRTALAALAKRLDYKVSGELPVEWRDAKNELVHAFYPIASAVLGEIFLKSSTDPARSIIVLPGRRAVLALYKIERDPRFEQAVEDGWRFLKFRHLRRLAENQSLTRDSFTELLDLDPLTLEQAQAPLL